MEQCCYTHKMEGIFLEEIIREESTTSFERKIFAAGALILIGCLFVYEWNGLQETKRLNLLGWGIDLVLLALWVLQGSEVLLRNEKK